MAAASGTGHTDRCAGNDGAAGSRRQWVDPSESYMAGGPGAGGARCAAPGRTSAASRQRAASHAGGCGCGCGCTGGGGGNRDVAGDSFHCSRHGPPSSLAVPDTLAHPRFLVQCVTAAAHTWNPVLHPLYPRRWHDPRRCWRELLVSGRGDTDIVAVGALMRHQRQLAHWAPKDRQLAHGNSKRVWSG